MPPTRPRQAPRPLPLVHRWDDDRRPLPVRAVQRPPHGHRRAAGLEAPPWLPTGPEGEPFDFSAAVAALCKDIARHCDELSHIDADQLLFGITQARNGRVHGLQARVTPLRFRGGTLTRRRQGVDYLVQRYFVGPTEKLYLVTFCLPRFLDQDFDDKMITLFHELYHVSPSFDGDLRRHAGRYEVHTRSQELYDKHMAQLARGYLSNGADRSLHTFLRLNFAQLEHRHGSVTGVVVPRPRLLPVAAQVSTEGHSVE